MTNHLLSLDPLATNVWEEGERIRKSGCLVPVALPGGLTVWATADRGTGSLVFAHRDFRKDPRHWAALQSGEVPGDWPLLKMITLGMLAKDGADHRRLRSLVSSAFTPRRVERLRPLIEDMTRELVDNLGAMAPGNPIDLRSTFAFELPMGVICSLFGLEDRSVRKRLAADYTALIDSRSTPEQAQAAEAGIGTVIAELIAQRRERPGGDLTTALLAAHDAQDGSLDQQELMETLFLFLFAGHETTRNLITNAAKNLMAHRDQLRLVRSGTVKWSAVVEETLRHYSPISTVMFRYAARDIELPDTGVTVRQGEAVLVCVAATGRDEDHFGPQADAFDVTRPPGGHLSFGHGPHFCIGAPLARMMASTALDLLFTRFDLSPAPGYPTAESEPSFSSNCDRELPVLLTPFVSP
ncbi:cytochrome P450 family protein [Streptomyces sp. NPDC002004]